MSSISFKNLKSNVEIVKIRFKTMEVEPQMTSASRARTMHDASGFARQERLIHVVTFVDCEVVMPDNGSF